MVDPTRPGTLYAITADGVMTSPDRGLSWQPLGTGLAGTPLWTLAVDAASGALYAGSQVDGLLVLARDTNTWMPRSRGLVATTVVSLAVAPRSPTTAYAGLWNGVARTTDGGATWMAVNDGLPPPDARLVSALAVDPTNPGIAWAGTMRGLFKTVDGGSHWIPSGDAPGGVRVQALAADPSTAGTVYAAIDDLQNGRSDVYQSRDGGTTWHGTGLNRSVTAIAVDPGTPSTVLAGIVPVGIVRSADGAATWSAPIVLPVRTPVPLGSIRFDPDHPGTAYAASESEVMRSADGGRTWTRQQLGPPSGPLNFSDLWAGPQEPLLYVVENLGLVAGERGKCWQPLEESAAPVQEATVLAASPTVPGPLYAGAFGRGVFVHDIPAERPKVPAGCVAEPVPRSVLRSLEAGCRLADRAYGKKNVDAGNALLRKAFHRWRRGVKPLARAERQMKLSPACVRTLRTMLTGAP